MVDRPLHIGFISTRLEGTDGVSLEAFKWADAFAEMGHECFYFAGACDRPPERLRVCPRAHFEHPDVLRLNADLFGQTQRSPQTSDQVHDLWRVIKHALGVFVAEFELDLLVVENAFSLPMNIPLGMAITDLVAETNIPTIAHHHDFVWERSRYLVNAAQDYLEAAFPPTMEGIRHVVINSHGARELAWRTGLRPSIIPNVMDFEHPPGDGDTYADDLRCALGLSEDDLFLLQPTRVVPRKCIERALELSCRLDRPCALVVSHGAGDEGCAYQDYLVDQAERLGVHLILAASHFNHHRGRADNGAKIYALADAYRNADLVTYPSAIEGFGNAFLEAVYHRRPIVVNAYNIFKTDIRPKGFQVVEFTEFVDRATVEATRNLLDDPTRIAEMVEINYQLGRKHFSYSLLRMRLAILLERIFEGL